MGLEKKFDENEQYRIIVQKAIAEGIIPKKIDSNFIEKHYGNYTQALFCMKALESDVTDALIMNGFSGIDCRGINFETLTFEEFSRLTFDTNTIFSKETIEKFQPEKILEDSKKFGLGVEQLPLTGNGIHVAIIDENCDPSNLDINLASYYHNGNNEFNPENDIDHYHGKTVCSLLASKSCGVAKGVKIHFYSCPVSEAVEQIEKYNTSCEENDRILILSASKFIKGFDECQQRLNQVGCEIVSANNFDTNFFEYIGSCDNPEIPLKLNTGELNALMAKFPKAQKQILYQLNRYKNVKIPISRTYHQIGENAGFKHQASYSTSWGIPQVAGLFALFKEKDRSLTFEEFCDFAKQTAEGREQIISPQKIYDVLRQKNNYMQTNKSAIQVLGEKTISTPISDIESATKVVTRDLKENEIVK